MVQVPGYHASAEGQRYRLLRRLGQGGMAEVFEAELAGALGFARKVAIKRMLGDAVNAAQAQRFVDEARIAAQLHHANIVSILDVGLLDGLPFQVLELVDGIDAHALLSKCERLPVDVALVIAHEIAHALDHAHGARDANGLPLGIVHRDVKPSNVLVSWSGDVKLTDFGIALAHDRTTKTETGMVAGTNGFIAPEQRMLGELDGRTDVFALGITLHALLAGYTPLRNFAVEMAAIEGTPIPIDSLIPADIADLIAHAIAPRRLDRWTAAQFAEAIGGTLVRRLSRDARSHLRAFLARFRESKPKPGALDQILGLEVVLTGASAGPAPPLFELRRSQALEVQQTDEARSRGDDATAIERPPQPRSARPGAPMIAGVRSPGGTPGPGWAPTPTSEETAVAPTPTSEQTAVAPTPTSEETAVAPTPTSEETAVAPTPTSEGTAVAPIPTTPIPRAAAVPTVAHAGVAAIPPTPNPGFAASPTTPHAGVAVVPATPRGGLRAIPTNAPPADVSSPHAHPATAGRRPARAARRIVIGGIVLLVGIGGGFLITGLGSRDDGDSHAPARPGEPRVLLAAIDAPARPPVPPFAGEPVDAGEPVEDRTASNDAPIDTTTATIVTPPARTATTKPRAITTKPRAVTTKQTGTGYLQIVGADNLGARILLDGRPIGFAPDKLVAPLGRHRIVVVRKNGEMIGPRTITIDEEHTLTNPAHL